MKIEPIYDLELQREIITIAHERGAFSWPYNPRQVDNAAAAAKLVDLAYESERASGSRDTRAKGDKGKAGPGLVRLILDTYEANPSEQIRSYEEPAYLTLEQRVDQLELVMRRHLGRELVDLLRSVEQKVYDRVDRKRSS